MSSEYLNAIHYSRPHGTGDSSREDSWTHLVPTPACTSVSGLLVQSSHSFLKFRPWQGPGHPPPPGVTGLQSSYS